MAYSQSRDSITSQAESTGYLSSQGESEKIENYEIDKLLSHVNITKPPSGWMYSVGFYRPVDHYVMHQTDLINHGKMGEAKKLRINWIKRMLNHVKHRNIWPPDRIFGGMFWSTGYYPDYYYDRHRTVKSLEEPKEDDLETVDIESSKRKINDGKEDRPPRSPSSAPSDGKGKRIGRNSLRSPYEIIESFEYAKVSKKKDKRKDQPKVQIVDEGSFQVERMHSFILKAGGGEEGEDYQGEAIKDYLIESAGESGGYQGEVKGSQGQGSQIKGSQREQKAYQGQLKGSQKESGGSQGQAKGSQKESGGSQGQAKGSQKESGGYQSEAKGSQKESGGYQSEARGYQSESEGYLVVQKGNQKESRGQGFSAEMEEIRSRRKRTNKGPRGRNKSTVALGLQMDEGAQWTKVRTDEATNYRSSNSSNTRRKQNKNRKKAATEDDNTSDSSNASASNSKDKKSGQLLPQALNFRSFDFFIYSRHKILVTNLPKDATESDLHSLFLNEISIEISESSSSPTGRIAILTFSQRTETQEAYDRNRYAKIKGKDIIIQPVRKSEGDQD